MKLERRFSADWVAAIAIGSSLAVWLAISAMIFPHPFGDGSPASFGEKIYYCSLFIIAVAATVQMYLAIAAFRRGVAEAIWPLATVDKLKYRIERPMWTALAAALITGALLYVIVDITRLLPHHHHGNGGLLYFWISPSITLGQLRSTLRPQSGSGSGHSIWTGGVKPLSSEHWGER
jgi:hypothetical protein